MGKIYDGSGHVSAEEQAKIAYRQMRESLVQFAAAEVELAERQKAGELTPTLESLIFMKLVNARERAVMFAAVYHVEMAVVTRREW